MRSGDMLEVVSRYLLSNCFSWTLEKKTSSSSSPNLFQRNYQVVRKIGAGGYGTVFLVVRRTDGKEFAAKIIPEARCRRMSWCNVRGMPVPDEVTIWEQLPGHDNILKLEESYRERGHWILITEYLPDYVDLFDYNSDMHKLSEADIRAVLGQIISTCQHLVASGIDHRDIKDENLLFNPKTKHIKLLDFGSASRIVHDHVYTHIQGTDIYIPHEYYASGSYTPRGGAVWAIGCLAYIMVNCRPPFVNRDHVRTHEKLAWSNNTQQRVREFIEGCLVKEPENRWKLEELLEYQWFEEGAE